MNTGNTVATSIAGQSAPPVDGNSPASGQQARTGSSFSRFAARSAHALLHAATLGGLVGLALFIPSFKVAVVGAYSKFGVAIGQAGTAVSVHSAAIAGGTVAAGALNILDGFQAYRTGGRKVREYTVKMGESNRQSAEVTAFSKLKKLYASTRNRGKLQILVGTAAVAVGALVLAGVVSNPYGLVAAGVVAAAVLIGAQIHKYIINRRIAHQKTQLNLSNQEARAAGGPNQRDVPEVQAATADGGAHTGVHAPADTGTDIDSVRVRAAA